MLNPAPFIKRVTDRQYGPFLKSDRYLFVLNYVDQTVSVIDTNSATGTGNMSSAVIATITLTASKNFYGMDFRSADRCVYVFGTNSVDKLDADDQSGTFATKLANYTVTAAAGNFYHVSYNPNDDLFYMNNMIFNPKTQTTSTLTNKYASSYGLDSSYPFKIIPELNHLIVGDRGKLAFDMYSKKMIGGIQTNAVQNGEFVYHRNTNQLYFCGVSGSGGFKVYDINYLLKVQINNTNINISGLAVGGKTSLRCVGGHNGANTIGAFDVASMTSLGGFTKSNLDTNETLTKSILYSNYSDRMFIQASANGGATTGVARIHVIDPNLAIGSMYQGYINVGNMSSLHSTNFATKMMVLT